MDTNNIQNSHPIPWRIRTFGGFSISPTPSKKFRTRKTEQLAALLALRPGTYFNRDTLAYHFWPDDPQESARQSLRMAISNIRTVLGKEAIHTNRESTALSPSQVTSDLAEFENALEFARAEPENALRHRQTAFNLTAAPWLPEYQTEWTQAESPRIQEQITENALALVHLLKSESQQEAIHIAKQTLEVVGCREDLHIALMQIYIDAGLTSLALAQFETLESQLDELWGEPPSETAIKVIESAPRSTRLPNLPRQIAPIEGLYGRENELTQLSESLADPHQPALIVLTGPGGTGKTSLALATGKILENQGQTVHFIDLTRDTSLNSAAATVIQSLNIPNIDSAESISAIARTFSASTDLYILDNLEQLGEDSTKFITQIHQAAPNSRILVTSRQAVHYNAQTRIAIHPLPTPKPKSLLSEIRQTASVQLFEQQAKLANPNFEISARNADSVAELCRRLDGIPLAIKLAAARTIIRTPAQILSNLNSNLEPIGKQPTDSPDRHRNIFATTEWSLNLLTPEARTLALSLSIYSGRFTEEIANSLNQSPTTSSSLAELVDASLLNVNSQSDPAQFWFFETIRTALIANLQKTPQVDEAHQSLLNLTLSTAISINNKPELEGWQRLRLHYQNLENSFTALEFAIENSKITPEVAELGIITQRILSSLNSERITPILRKLYESAHPQFSPSLRASIGVEYYSTLANRGSVELQSSILHDCLELAQNDPKTLIRVQLALSAHFKTLGKYEEAIQTLDTVLAQADPTDHELLALTNYRQGLNYGCLNDRPKCYELFSTALPHARKAKEINQLVRILFDLGSELAFRGEGDRAIDCFIEAEAICETVGSRKLEGLTRWQHGDALLDLNRPAEALDQLKQSITLVYEGQYPAAEKWIFIKAAQAAFACDAPELAAKLLAKGKSVREAENRTLAVYEIEYIDKTTSQITEMLGADTVKKLQVIGQNTEWAELWQQFQALQ